MQTSARKQDFTSRHPRALPTLPTKSAAVAMPRADPTLAARPLRPSTGSSSQVPKVTPARYTKVGARLDTGPNMRKVMAEYNGTSGPNARPTQGPRRSPQ